MSKYFIMAPEGLEYESRLQRWLTQPGINPHAVCYAIIRMIGRVARNKERAYPISEVLYGLNNKNIPYRMLKEIVTKSGLFECEGGFVHLNYYALPYFLHHGDDDETNHNKGGIRYFIMVPEGLETDPRIQPWLHHDHVSPEALCYTIVRMMGRLYNATPQYQLVEELIAGFNSKNVSRKFLESMVRESGFFEVRGDCVLYNWEKFCDNSGRNSAPPAISSRPLSEEKIPLESLSIPPAHPDSSPESSPETSPITCACEDNNKNKKQNLKINEIISVKSRVEGGTYFPAVEENSVSTPVQQSVSTAVKIPVSTEQKVPFTVGSRRPADDGIEAHIHKIFSELFWLEEKDLKGWYGRTIKDRLKVVERRFIHMLSLKDSKLAAAVGRSLGLENYRELWRYIIDAYVLELCCMGYITKVDRPGKENTYLLVLTSRYRKNWQYNPRQSILNIIRDSLEKCAAQAQERPQYKTRLPLKSWSSPESQHGETG